jgi:hypothetical protein
MSEMKHTSEPLSDFWIDCDVENAREVICDMILDEVTQGVNYCDDVAQRIVACVNACAGMNDPANEIATLRARVAELEKATEPTTVREWLEQLPDGYRERALEQCDCLDERCTSMSMALIIFSVWEDTQEKFRFWNAVDEHYAERTPLPPLPEQI